VLYHILKIPLIPTWKTYFKSIHFHNKSAIPSSGPVILAVNHTSAFMDPILIAVLSKRTFHFLARGEAFNSRFSSAFYSNLNMLPLYRPETSPNDIHKNKFAFQKCFTHLKEGKAIMMFPEGFSESGRKIRPIKSGIARLALGAEEQNDFNLNLKIIAVGLNYSNPHIFRSDVFINIGSPILVSDFKEDFEINEKKAYNALTAAVKQSLEECTVVINDERLYQFISHVEKIYQYRLDKNQQGLKKFMLSKEIVEKVEVFSNKSPEKFKEMEVRLSNYIQRLKRLKIKDNRILEGRIKTSFILNSTILTLGFPVFLCGFILNIIPFSLTSYVIKKIKVREDFIGSLRSIAGMFIFLIFYILTSVMVGIATSWYWGIAFGLILYPFGILALIYVNRYMDLKEDYKHTRLFKRKATFMAQLRKERKEIINQLAEAL